MQQDSIPSDGEQQQEPDWVLATYGQRVGAWLIDSLFLMPLLMSLMFVVWVLFGMTLIIGFYVSRGGDWTDFSVDMPIIFWVALSLFLALVICYIVWWLVALGRGQTPGKQIMGIRVIKDNGEPSGWNYTFLREFVIKGLLVSIASVQTLGVAWMVDSLWPLWDRAEKMQTLHDKLLGTLVVLNR